MQNIILYLSTVLIWGSTWIALNFQKGPVAPEASVFYRFLLAFSSSKECFQKYSNQEISLLGSMK